MVNGKIFRFCVFFLIDNQLGRSVCLADVTCMKTKPIRWSGSSESPTYPISKAKNVELKWSSTNDTLGINRAKMLHFFALLPATFDLLVPTIEMLHARAACTCQRRHNTPVHPRKNLKPDKSHLNSPTTHCFLRVLPETEISQWVAEKGNVCTFSGARQIFSVFYSWLLLQ